MNLEEMIRHFIYADYYEEEEEYLPDCIGFWIDDFEVEDYYDKILQWRGLSKYSRLARPLDVHRFIRL